MKLPKVDIEMGQDGKTYIMTVDVVNGFCVQVDLDQEDIDYMKRSD